MGPACASLAGPGAQGAHHWSSPAPDRQWPCTGASLYTQLTGNSSTTLAIADGPGNCALKTACFARVIDIASRIIIGVQAKKPMSASTKRNSKKRISGAQDEGMGPLAVIRAFSDGHEGGPVGVHRAFSDGHANRKLTYLPVFCSFDRTEIQANRIYRKAQGKLTYLPVFCSFNRTEFRTSREQKVACQ